VSDATWSSAWDGSRFRTFRVALRTTNVTNPALLAKARCTISYVKRDPECSDSRRESHVSGLLRRFATQKLDILDARYEFANRSEAP
jgi:hypothetical protein